MVDVCAGTGDFLNLFLSGRNIETNNTLVEKSGHLAEAIKSRFGLGVNVLQNDALSARVAGLLRYADWILLNPPFRAYKNCNNYQKRKIRELGFLPDLGACIIKKVLTEARQGAVCLVVGKRIFFEGLGFKGLQEFLELEFEQLSYVTDIGKIVAGSNKAKCALLVVRKRECAVTRALRGNGFGASFGDFADVVAGPSTGDDKKFLGFGETDLVRVPRGGQFLVGSSNVQFAKIRWVPEQFRYRRSMDRQGEIGIAYGLIRNDFSTAVKPSWARFLSGTPCIFPHEGSDGHIALGLLSLKPFRILVSSSRHGLSLNPGHVKRIEIPPIWMPRIDEIRELGREVRRYVELAEVHADFGAFHSERHLKLSRELFSTVPSMS